MTTNNHTANALMTQNAATNNTNSIHPLMQANFGHPNMEQIVVQLLLAASGKTIVSGNNTNTSLMQHNLIGSPGVTNNQTQQQQLTAAIMGFVASHIPNIMKPTYNSSVPITYQQMASGQYHLPVTFAQIQQFHQQQQRQQHQQTQQSHLLLGNNQNPSDMTVGNNSQQTNMNFATGSTTNSQQTMLPTSYTNFSNQAIAVTPYQIPGMMHAFSSPSGPANAGTQLMSTNPPSVNINCIASSVSNSRYLSSTNSSNQTSNNTNTNLTLSNHNNISNIALSSSNNNNTLGQSTITAASMASLYQQLPPQNAINAPFDFHQHQLLYNQRLLQAQQQYQ